MFLQHYNLRKKPFEITSDPEFLWFGRKHKEALATLEKGIFENKGFILLTGEVGTGKTTLINKFTNMNDVASIVVTIPDPGMEALDFFNFLANELKMEFGFNNKDEFYYRLKGFLFSAYASYKKVLIIIDEAQRLNHELLEEIHQLASIEMAGRKFLKIFFIGQIEFNEILMDEKNKQVKQEIVAWYNIEPLTVKETAYYIYHRLKIAGAKYQIFTLEAVKRVYTITRGYPRLTNILCDHALLSGYVKGVSKIDEDIVKGCEKKIVIQLGLIRPKKYETPLVGEQKEIPNLKRASHNYVIEKTPIFNKEKKRSDLKKAPQKYKTKKKIWITIIVALIVASITYVIQDDHSFNYFRRTIETELPQKFLDLLKIFLELF